MLRHLIVSFLFIVQLGLYGCSKPADELNEKLSNTSEIQQSTPEPTHEPIKDWDYYQAWMPTAPKEDLDDPSQWEDFRLEFRWKPSSAPRKQSMGLYSMKLDGTDIRLAAGPELLFGDENARIFGRMRSPNNRYILARFISNKRGDFTAIVDLKEQTTKVLDQSISKPRISWSQDSKFAYYYGDLGLTKYDVEKQELIDVEPSINVRLLVHLYDDNFLAATQNGYDFMTQGKKNLFSVELNRNYGNSSRIGISPDNRYIYVRDTETCIFDLTNQFGDPIFCTEDAANDHMDLTLDSIAHHGGRTGTRLVPFNGGKFIQILDRDALSLPRMKVINRQLSKDSKPIYPYMK